MKCLLDDARCAPAVFLWHGPIGRTQLEEWISRKGWIIPADLLEFWAIAGGGHIFESETFLRPLITDGREEIIEVTNWCLRLGMPSGLVVFHEGLGFTAIRTVDGAYVSLDSSARPTSEYNTLDHWYRDVLRAEYGERYGLNRIM